MSPRMFVIAGPPASGKSTAFPVSGFGVDFFNADDRAAALNGGSYLDIPGAIRDNVNRLFEAFVIDHVERRISCAFETTLLSSITFEQAARVRRPTGRSEMVSPWKWDSWHSILSLCIWRERRCALIEVVIAHPNRRCDASMIQASTISNVLSTK